MKARFLAVALLALGCRKSVPPAPETPPALRVLVSYGSEKKAWLEEQMAAFNAGSPRLPSGASVRVEGKAMGSGEAMLDILDGRLQPAVFSPASAVYLTLLNQAWLSRAGHTRAIAPPGDSVVISPVVIALWRPMAEALGWPARALGWSDLTALGRDRAGWSSKGHPQWGRFKLGHTHPEYSSSGLLAVLAEAYAGAGKTRGLDPADLEATKTKAFIAGVEASIVHYGKSTGFFAEKMRERGPSYLSAAVLYENLVIESYASPGELPLVAVYPREGTFWADHPYSILDAPWVTPEVRQGAQTFLDHLKGRSAQERALALGFRPADPAIPVAAPIDAQHGVDPKQPQTLLEIPGAATLDRLLAVWRGAKKSSDVTLVFDKSGSMRGKPLIQAKAGARAFLDGLDQRDSASLLFFDDKIYPLLGPASGPARAALTAEIDGTSAGGGTALYDAVISAYGAASQRARGQAERIHALVVMTDGNDENSTATLQAVKSQLASEDEAPVKVFTIAYGQGAADGPLGGIAEAGRGSSFTGTVENIVQVYRDITSFF